MAFIHRRVSILKIYVFLFMMALAVSLVTIRAWAKDDRSYITSRSELAKAVSDDQEVIYVGDIEFEENDIYFQVDRGIKLIGKPEGSVFKKGMIHINGSEVESELINVSFENIIFDGCYLKPEGNPNEADSFDSFYGDRSGKGCFTVKGFVGLTVKNCTFKNYCTKYGAAIYLQYTDGNADLRTRAKISIENCSFSGNICEKGVFWCNGKNTALELKDCSFTENQAYTGIVVLGGIKGNAENVTVKNNIRVSFKKKNSFPSGGGGILLANSDAVIRNCLIEGNGAPAGGGIMVTGSKATIDSCRILNNTADSFGGGISIESGEDSPVYITNCLISGNSAKEEGAVWVAPADQIGVGLPTGIVEFSFCTIENNNSEDEEHLLFHPVMLENPDSVIGRDGKIDFIACRINDSKVNRNLRDGDEYNIINSDKKGATVPPDAMSRIANGYYSGREREMYPGMNEMSGAEDGSRTDKKGRQDIIVAACAIVFAILAGVVFFMLRAKDRVHKTASEKLKHEGARNPEESFDGIIGEKTVEKQGLGEKTVERQGLGEKTIEKQDLKSNQTEPEHAETVAAEENLTERFESIVAEKKLTEREADVLREYLSGKNRSQISEALYISESTVKNHISNIFSKLGVKNKNELLKLCHSSGGES